MLIRKNKKIKFVALADQLQIKHENIVQMLDWCIAAQNWQYERYYR